MSDQETSIVMDQGGDGEVEDLRLKIKRSAKAKQTEALAASLVAAVRTQDVEAAQQALVSVREGKLDKLEVAELLVGRTSLKEWRKMTKMVRMEKMRRLSATIKEENVEDDQKKRIVQCAEEKLPQVNFLNLFLPTVFCSYATQVWVPPPGWSRVVCRRGCGGQAVSFCRFHPL